jgi:hypothetical protein
VLSSKSCDVGLNVVVAHVKKSDVIYTLGLQTVWHFCVCDSDPLLSERTAHVFRLVTALAIKKCKVLRLHKRMESGKLRAASSKAGCDGSCRQIIVE